MEGCIGSAHWKACKACRNNDSEYGCVIKEEIPLSLHYSFVLCGDYEGKTTETEQRAQADAAHAELDRIMKKTKEDL